MFEGVVLNERWDRDSWGLTLVPFLSWETLLAYYALSPEKAADYDIPKTKILICSGHSPTNTARNTVLGRIPVPK